MHEFKNQSSAQCQPIAREVFFARRPPAFTLIELLVVVAIIALLIAILIPSLSLARSSAQRVKCAANLHAIGLSLMVYSEEDPDRSFPRTAYIPSQNLQLDNAGYQVQDSFGNKGYVGVNNVPASLFLLMKVQRLAPELFICPSTQGTPGFVTEDLQQSSNWKDIPTNMSYSLAAPFPGVAGVNAGFKWRPSPDPQFVLAADINPGTRGGGQPPNNVTGPAHTASAGPMAAANSNNHQNKGQNVLFTDVHIEFLKTPYCGAIHPSTGIYDNIFTAGTGDNGSCDDKAYPVDAEDSVLLPTDDPGGK